jgi:predicted acetyltransferase
VRESGLREQGIDNMGEGELRLIEPAEGMREQCLAYIDEFRAAGEACHSYWREQVLNDFDGFLQKCRNEAAGGRMGWHGVPITSYWLTRRGRILGTCRLRHRLNDRLVQHGGHIGYDVRPSERGRGYATRMLAMVLEKAGQLGLTRVMLTCDKDNVASARVIQKNGGVLDAEYECEEHGATVMVQRYWIDLEAQQTSASDESTPASRTGAC